MDFQKTFTRVEALNTKEAREILGISKEVYHPFTEIEVENMILNALFETVWLDDTETLRGYSFNRFLYLEYLEAKEGAETLLQFVGII